MSVSGVNRLCCVALSQVEKRWIEFFNNPPMWWDNRCSVETSEFSTGETLPVCFCPQWMQHKLAFLDSRNTGFRAGYAGSGFGEQKSVSQYVAALRQCSKMKDLEGGKKLHYDAVAAGLHTNNYVATSLIAMYSKCRSMATARQVFDLTIHKDVAVWNSIILGYVQNGESKIALDLFAAMDCEPNSATYVAALKACGGLASQKRSEMSSSCLERVTEIYRRAAERGFGSDMLVANTLVEIYGKCGSMDRAREVFDRMISKNVVTWTFLILGYVQNGESYAAMDAFDRMDCEADSFTFAAALKACATLASDKESEKDFCLEKGITIHRRIGPHPDVFLASSLVDMYSKCNSMDRAREVFDRMLSKDVVTWTSLILGYVQNGENSSAMDLFTRMSCKPNSVTYVAALKACGGLASEKESEKLSCLQKGISIHKQAKDQGFESDIVLASSLVDMYSKCGSMDRAREVFDRMVSKNVVTWTSLILGYVQNGESSAAMDAFNCMDCEPNPVTYAAVLKACGSLAALTAGEEIHCRACRLGVEGDPMVGSTLMDFYGKCGSMKRAQELFNNTQHPHIVSWTTLMAGYSSVGDSSQVFNLAKQIREAGMKMDAVAFTCILTACSHSGLVDEGRACFQSMARYGVHPSVEHYNCMVDMLGRSNRLQEALQMVSSMGCEANAVTWKTLLGACRKWKNLEVGRVAFDGLLAADPTDASAYVFMSDIYRSLSMWRDLEQMDAERQGKTGLEDLRLEGRSEVRVGA